MSMSSPCSLTAVERLERTSHYENVPFALVHDEVPDLLVRKVARKARRRITAGSAYGVGPDCSGRDPLRG